MEIEFLNEWCRTGRLSFLDIHFARFMEGLAGGDMPELALAAALASSAVGRGHVCLDLRRPWEHARQKGIDASLWPSMERWHEVLGRCKVVGSPGEYRPLILDGAGRLYLYRYWEYQQKLSEGLKARMEAVGEPLDPVILREPLARLFPVEESADAVDWQKVAAFSSMWHSLCVVSGGPGTGKTTTVARILALLLERTGGSNLRMALAAPTGKAAARLQEAIAAAREKLNCEDGIKSALPVSASTIHRLLGATPGSSTFRHNEENPLPLDVLVVDEASMVDLPLMSRLIQALPLSARLILLGDKDQLASVEAGAVLGDICSVGEPVAFSPDFADACQKACGFALKKRTIRQDRGKENSDCIVQLQKSYRFSAESGIAVLSRKVREKDVEGALAFLRGEKYADLVWNEVPSCHRLGKAIKGEVVDGFRHYLVAANALGSKPREAADLMLKKVFALFEGFRILCALREGLCGVSALNRLTESILQEEGLLVGGKRWYVGRPVIVTRNDYGLRLFNGDVGIYLPDIVGGREPRVFFASPDDTFRSFHPQRLPEHETVFAMTVHKSQGSEFDDVLLVLPDRDSPVLTRELIYTGITRARKRVSLWGSQSVMRSAVARSTERLSGLSDALWGESSL